jgi:hypothetical protein
MTDHDSSRPQVESGKTPSLSLRLRSAQNKQNRAFCPARVPPLSRSCPGRVPLLSRLPIPIESHTILENLWIESYRSWIFLSSPPFRG